MDIKEVNKNYVSLFKIIENNSNWINTSIIIEEDKDLFLWLKFWIESCKRKNIIIEDKCSLNNCEKDIKFGCYIIKNSDKIPFIIGICKEHNDKTLKIYSLKKNTCMILESNHITIVLNNFKSLQISRMGTVDEKKIDNIIWMFR